MQSYALFVMASSLDWTCVINPAIPTLIECTLPHNYSVSFGTFWRHNSTFLFVRVVLTLLGCLKRSSSPIRLTPGDACASFPNHDSSLFPSPWLENDPWWSTMVRFGPFQLSLSPLHRHVDMRPFTSCYRALSAIAHCASLSMGLDKLCKVLRKRV